MFGCPNCGTQLVIMPAPNQRPSLTTRQRAALDFIRAYMAENEGVAPTYREIARAAGIATTSGTWQMLSNLKKRGYIDYQPGQRRTITLIEPLP